MSKEKEPIVLPKKRLGPSRVDPLLTVLYGNPKGGKTYWTTKLPNALHLDAEQGTETWEAMRLKVDSYKKLTEVAAALNEEKKSGFMYDFIIFDTADRLMEWLEGVVVKNHNARMQAMQEANPDKYYPLVQVYSEIEYGKGYDLVRLELRRWMKFFRSVAKHVIVIAHLKRTLIGENTVMVDETNLDITGRAARLLLSDADATGLVSSIGATIQISFEARPNSVAGSRIPHLAGRKFMLKPGDTDKTWANIFRDTPKEDILALHPDTAEVYEELAKEKEPETVTDKKEDEDE